MTVNVGTMQLPVTEDADLVRTYLNGTHVSGGLWTALTRASNHDHSGGLNGIQLTATSIPDGSITTAKLDPSVLLPYALVDGSKPFTGQVSMNADAIVRERLFFGPSGAGTPTLSLSHAPQGTSGTGSLMIGARVGVAVTPHIGWHASRQVLQVGPTAVLAGSTGDAEYAEVATNSYLDTALVQRAFAQAPATRVVLQNGGLTVRTAPQVNAEAVQTFTTRMTIDLAGNLGVGVTPAAWGATMRAVQLGEQGAVWADAAGNALRLTSNIFYDGTTSRALAAGPASQVLVGGGQLQVFTAPAVAAGAAQTYSLRAVLAPTGTLTLSPDAGVASLTWGSGALQTNAGNPQIVATGAQNLELYGNGGYVHPSVDGLINFGAPSKKWGTVYAAVGTINTSTAAVKEGITPLDPAACYQAAKDVRWYEFAYRPPVYAPPEPPPDIAYDAADDNETKAEKKAARDEAEAASKAAHLKMVAETAPARHQRGFVFPAGAESKDEAGGALPPVPDLFGLSDRESTTPQADLATLGAAMQELIRRFEVVEAKVP